MIVNIGPHERLTEETLAKLKEVVNAEQDPIEYLAIDPGKANGVCGYNAKHYLMFMFTISAEDMILFLYQFKKVKKCITEGYRVYPNKAKDHIYSDLETPRVIGRIESWAETNKVELIMQPATIKKTGYLWIGERQPSKKDPQNHVKDAHVHFMYWAVSKGYIPAKSLVKRTFK